MGGGEGGGGMRGVGKRSTGGGHMHRAGGGHMHRASGGHNKIHVAAHQKHQNFHKQAQDRFKKMQQDHRRQQDRRRRQELAFGRQQVAVFRKRNGLFGHKKWRVTGLGQRRRQHRARYTGRSGSSGGPGFFLSCCFGIQPKTPTQRNQEDIQTLQRYQNKLIECHQQELALKQAENTDTSDAVQSAPSAPPPTNDKVMAQGAHELQREQHELLNDILDQLREETDPERLEELYRQQRELIGQMEQLHAAGFQNAVSIQPVHPYGRPGVPTAPVAEVMMGGGDGAGEGEGGRRSGRRGRRGHRAHHNAHHRAQQRRQHRRHRQHAAWRRRRHGLFGRKKWGVTGLGHRRRQRRVRYTGGSGASGGAGSLFCCCFGIQPKTPIQQNEEDLQTLQRYQNEIIECHKQELALKQEKNADQGADMGQDPPGYNTVMGIQPQGGAFGTNQTLTGTHPEPIPSAPGMVPPPVAGQQVADMPSAPSAPPPTYDEVMAQDAQELQREQHELLNDILDQQREETEPERLEELYMQHRELIGQMEQLHAAGFHYAGDIPPVPQYGGPGVQPAPVREVMDVGIAVNS